METMKYVLITGVSTGIGFTTAQYLINKGYLVIGSIRKKEDELQLKTKLGDHFKAIHFDVTDDQAIEATFQQVADIVGQNGLAGLVNNAGMCVSGPLQHVDIDQVRYQMEVNVIGALKVIQTFLPLLGAHLSSPFAAGKIINISSVSGRFTAPFVGPYCASKYALEAISDGLRRELSIYGISVVSIEPGPIKTPIWQKTLKKTANYQGTDYAPLFKKLHQLIDIQEKRAIPAEKVAKRIYKTLQLRKPSSRYIVAANRLSFWLLFYVIPDWIIDSIVKRQLKKGLLVK